MISAGKARAIRMGINLGRLIALDVALSISASDPQAAWRIVEPYRGIHMRAYRRATERGAESEGRRIINERFEDEEVWGNAQDRTAPLKPPIDDYLLHHFGSREAAERFAHLYVLEVESPRTELVPNPGHDLVMRSTIRYRLRLKTVEELTDKGTA